MFSRLLARGVLTGLLWAAGACALGGQAGHAVAAPVGQSLPPLRYAALQGDDAKLWQFSTDPAGGTPQAIPLPRATETPLGSVWKLFVYSYLVTRRISTPDYTCHGGDPEEVYCCTPGNSIDRERALIQSCGRYFEPARLGLDRADWRRFWQEAGSPTWLRELRAMQPTQRVPVAELLTALRSVPAEGRETAAQTLISVLTIGRGEGTVSHFGGLLRAKTWTMPDPQRPGASIGGAAGWLADGTPVWLGGAGSSNQVLAAAAPRLTPLLAQTPVPDDDACVAVEFFARYPIREVRDASGKPAVPGRLEGRYTVRFANGNTLPIESKGELALARTNNAPVITGRLGMNDYVARVVEREGDLAEPQAARALAVAARSYVVQHAARDKGCYRIADTSRTQRVLPRPPAAAARNAAEFTDALVLTGAAVQYHGTASARGQMGWTAARAAAQRGAGFDAILAQWWPQATLTSFQSPVAGDCAPVAGAQQWLQAQAPRWSARLGAEPGYETPPLPAVCVVREGRPYADARRNRLYIHRLATEEDRIALAHEYLHLAFARHPRGQDEQFVEAMARRLIRGEGLL
ncbi:DUF2300 domain-containing protein [Ralstonia mannitolilytica]|uniref:Uncharacterized protein n=1 Tax=Ralstonia mannitolilytica TaxID=105219 RepID=A0AAD2EJ34_9RALS|nr:DUF2300 domain-containing protein [Ralstonia mannitolilytica]MBY4720612.1 DUF2300 domain-containing protein [Ralstonia mannitolilytica]CAJ0686347.1 hypothetical protein R77591_02893 [Ralstonia mannitolilytica]CAJ0702650.1 hypothetical protein LMG18102_03772 [Ralstonia mannitolilytica]CAJ0877725.1 hypothetical protein R77569_02919 [Ralstonia mannitolilytica]CAJ0893494.1 hypothetical protein R1479_03768 [Ralstonia mannitolilytica]